MLMFEKWLAINASKPKICADKVRTFVLGIFRISEPVDLLVILNDGPFVHFNKPIKVLF